MDIDISSYLPLIFSLLSFTLFLLFLFSFLYWLYYSTNSERDKIIYKEWGRTKWKRRRASERDVRSDRYANILFIKGTINLRIIDIMKYLPFSVSPAPQTTTINTCVCSIMTAEMKKHQEFKLKIAFEIIVF